MGKSPLKELQAAGFGILDMSHVNCISFKYQNILNGHRILKTVNVFRWFGVWKAVESIFCFYKKKKPLYGNELGCTHKEPLWLWTLGCGSFLLSHASYLWDIYFTGVSCLAFSRNSEFLPRCSHNMMWTGRLWWFKHHPLQPKEAVCSVKVRVGLKVKRQRYTTLLHLK